MITIEVENGKYTFEADDEVRCLRNGKPWIIFREGGKALIALMAAVAGDEPEDLIKGGVANFRHMPVKTCATCGYAHGQSLECLSCDVHSENSKLPCQPYVDTVCDDWSYK